MKEYLKQYILNDLQRCGVNIHDCDYKNSENYIKIKDDRISDSNYGSISLEEFIERYLLDKIDVLDTYKSIYDMGNPYELCDEECEDIALAREILSLDQPDNGEKEINEWTKSTDKYDQDAAAKAKTANQESIQEFAELFSRPGGYRERLKEFLSLDLDLFDKTNIKTKPENAKILFFFYMLEKKYFPTTNILLLLSKPSMENIDNYALGMEPYNREIISFIKNSLEKELSSSPIRKKIKSTLQSITIEWTEFLANVLLRADYLAGFGLEYDFDKRYDLFNLQSAPEEFIIKKITKYPHSPIETLYLKILQYEYLGNTRDILNVNLNQTEDDFNKRLKFAQEMKRLHHSPVDINDVNKYIDDNIHKIAKYVYLKEKTSRDERRRILNSKEKVGKCLNFFIRSNMLIKINDNLTELLIISCLQAILYDEKNNFNYIFPLYEEYMKHIPTTSAVLKNDERTLDALQIYWVRKVTDFWYANIGRNNIRIKLRKLENLCDNILIKILSIPNCDKMLEKHQFYFKTINQVYGTKNYQFDAVHSFEKFLNSRGFKYLDNSNKIRYMFLRFSEVIPTYITLISLVDDTINNKNYQLHITLENDENLIELEFKLIFNYQTKVCSMSEFKNTAI